ncbi:methyl-CpG-binding domain-containing protein 9 isoform X2 [Andrographis paniculata]|uniref:methyl-CpG-binding domain-containing protein 9 isoform X2 n=1 Tax=Andrographis paniculata TaxID=175694 RepID=UPI0021E7EC86|nr:methyl-CpG-binding domain-containing protein 9 isoform X2 [Andrographis paniculata]
MRFNIDLNETPVPSPRETVGEAGIPLCSVCGKGIPVGRVPGKAGQESKCFRCLLRSDAAGSSSGGGGWRVGDGGPVGLLDMNAPPPREPEEGDCVEVFAVPDGIQSSVPSSSSHHAAVRQMNPMLDDVGLYHQKMMSIATEATNSGFEDMSRQKLHLEELNSVRKESTFDLRVQGLHTASPVIELDSSPNMVYLQNLKDYIADRSGVLGDGWCVEFEFCNRRYKTTAVYIAPDGSRLKSMEDVAHYIGLPSRYQSMEIERESSTGFGLIQGGLKNDPSKKESSAFLTSQNSRQRQRISSAIKNQGILSGVTILSESEFSYNRGSEDVGFSKNGGIHDGFPIQFQDFFLISTGNVDPRPSYHCSSQIWPVGYRSCWHDRVTGSLFVFDIADGGDFGPIFKIQRYPCTKQSLPVGSTILSKVKPLSSRADGKVGKENLAVFQVVDDDSISTITLLNEGSPPSLDNCLSMPKKEDGIHNLQEDNSSNSDMECPPHRFENLLVDGVSLTDVVGEFKAEGRSTSSAWEMVTQGFLQGFHSAYKQKGAIKFFCGHDVQEANDENLFCNGSLSKYGSFEGRVTIPSLVQNEKDIKIACEMLLAWLNQDRFGLDADFVQEVIEQSPGVTLCKEYKSLSKRRHNSILQTVGSGFLKAERKTNNHSGALKRSQLKSGVTESTLKRNPCPPGTPLNSKLPSYLMGDALQVWEYACRYSDVLGLGLDFSFQELESELVSPWVDTYPLKSRDDIGNGPPSIGEKVPQAEAASVSRCSGLLSAKIIASLLKVLVSELMSKAAAQVWPNSDTGEPKSRRGKKKDPDSLAAFKKTKPHMLPINDLTWHEVAHRYILAVLSMGGDFEFTEISSQESGKVFHCLQGDGGILGGSIMGIAALERDAAVLADAVKEIYGSLKGKSEVVSLSERDSDANGAQTIEVNDGSIPEWAQVLEPVRKLPTNVGARIRRCIHEALERNPPEWAKQKLEYSISKDVYKGNASGPTKRAVIEVLSDLNCDNAQPRAERREKVKIKTSVTDLVSKQCRIVLRQALLLDEHKKFCNLLGRIVLSPNDSSEAGLIGYPAMVSRPLDFRTIDLRLAYGAYGGSLEAFIDDVREVWSTITAYRGQKNLDLALHLSAEFEALYEKEVLTLVSKISEVSCVGDPDIEMVKDRDQLLLEVSNAALPRPPWEEGLCKVCGLDRDDDNVLLCDKCDSEYHRYCLNPPLKRIPEGNWYCPSCLIPSAHSYLSASNQSRRRRDQGEFIIQFLEELARLANLMEIKEYWEFTIVERIIFMKFLFDEALSSATIREHMDQCTSRVTDLQSKLRILTAELRLLKVKDLVWSADRPTSGAHNGRGDLKSDASSSLPIESSLRGKAKLSEIASHLPSFSGFTQMEHGPSAKEHVGHSKHPDWLPLSRSGRSLGSADSLNQAECQNLLMGDQSQPGIVTVPIQPSGGSVLNCSQVMPGHNHSGSSGDHATDLVPSAPPLPVHESQKHPSPSQAEMLPSKDNISKSSTIKDDIVNMQNTIAAVESELLKISIRKDFLGRDSNGRVYWAFSSAGARPWIVASGDLVSKNRLPDEFMGVPGSDKWMYYESDDDVEKLIGWLTDNHVREKELRESILQLQSSKLRESQYTISHILSKVVSDHGKGISSDTAPTEAMAMLKKKFGPCLVVNATDACQRPSTEANQDGRMVRCECLELLWPSKDHCFSCHQSFASNEDLQLHCKEKCKATSKKSQTTTEDTSKRRKPKIVISQEKRPISSSFPQFSTSKKQNNGPSFTDPIRSGTPFNFEEIKNRFVVPGSVKQTVNEIGLIGSGGVPSFVPTSSPYLSDRTLQFRPPGMNKASKSGMPNLVRSQGKTSAVFGGQENKESTRSSRNAENGLAHGTTAERLRSALASESDQVSFVKEKGASLIGLSKSNLNRESSPRPLVGKGAEVLKLLKINLLDMDAALPDDALRPSRTSGDKRRAWREFVKSAKSIYEMVQAMVVFEDTIKTNYLRNFWWYWSSPSTAMKITTLSALALRIYSLDSAISYDKPLVNSAMVARETNPGLEEETPSRKNGSPSQQTPTEPDPADNTRTTRGRASKRRKDLSA